MKRLANHISFAKLALTLKKEEALNSQLKRIHAELVTAQQARRDIDEDLIDFAQPQKPKQDTFTKMQALIRALNSAPTEIRNAPETNTLIQKIFRLMTDSADSDRQQVSSNVA